MRDIKFLLMILMFLVNDFSYSSTSLEQVASEIREEALKPAISDYDRPLPLAASWNVGLYENAYTPSYQLALLKDGHHIIPWFHLDIPGSKSTIRVNNYYKEISEFSRLNLPISFISTQWERILSDKSTYANKATLVNPNTVVNPKKIEKQVSPMGDTKLWLAAGKEWTSTSQLKNLQTLYPNPPLVLFISNNEHKKLQWHESDNDYRFKLKYGANLNSEEKRKIFARQWVEKYRALQSGLKSGLTSVQWKSKSIFIGYNAFGPSTMARWPNWRNYSLDTNEYISPWPLAWDGASVPFYTHNWDPSTDYNVWGPMVSSMNWVYMKKEAQALNPNFWFEVSIWDGNQPRELNDKRKFYELEGHPYTPNRYQGMVKYSMWLLRPRVIREYRHPYQSIKETGDYFMKMVDAVDQIYMNDTLKRFWRQGLLIANNEQQHPYATDIPEKYKNEDRWFLLNTDLDARRPWTVHTTIPVFPIALKINDKPEREWLLYCFSPLANRSKVSIKIPDYQTVKVDCNIDGNYYHVAERSGLTSAIE